MPTLPVPRLLTDRIDHWADARPNEEAITYGDRTWTWSEFRDRVRRVSCALLTAGVRHGDRIAFVDKNHPACLEVTLGGSAIGAINAVGNWRLADEELVYVLNDCGARVLFVGAEFEPRVAGILEKVSSVERVIIVGGDADEYETFLADARPVGAQLDVQPGDTAFLIYTSGTTGFPKGAMLTHQGVNAHSASGALAFGLTAEDHNLVAMPLFHVAGTCAALFGMHAGARTTMTRESDLPLLFGAIERGVTHVFLVPTVIAGLLGAGDQAIATLSRVKLLAYGGSPCPLPVLHKALEVWPDVSFLQVYGTTEMSGVVTVLNPGPHRDASHPERLASAGQILPGGQLRVVDPETLTDVEPGESGELWFKTPSVMAGYWGKPEATAESLTVDGWYRTGDVGRLDDDGFIFIIDRIKDMIITGGENVYSPEVERVIAEFPGVAEVAVIGVPDPRWGETVKAVVARTPGATVDENELIAFCRERLADYKCPRTVDFVEELPRNATGKILKRNLRESVSDRPPVATPVNAR